MKQRCPRQHRIGETCGAKLLDHDSLVRVDGDCKTCQEIAVKQRRLQRERDNAERWEREGNKFRASIEKAHRESKQLEEAIADLQRKRTSVRYTRDRF